MICVADSNFVYFCHYDFLVIVHCKIYIITHIGNFNPCPAACPVMGKIEVSTVAADALVTTITKPSADMILGYFELVFTSCGDKNCQSSLSKKLHI